MVIGILFSALALITVATVVVAILLYSYSKVAHVDGYNEGYAKAQADFMHDATTLKTKQFQEGKIAGYQLALDDVKAHRG